MEADAGDDGGEEGAGQEAGGQAVEVLRCHADKVKGCVWRERGCFAVGKGFVEYSDTFKLAVWEGVRRGVLKVTHIPPPPRGESIEGDAGESLRCPQGPGSVAWR